MQAEKAKHLINRHQMTCCPYKLLMNGEQIDEFNDVRDAIASARVVKRENPGNQVAIIDQPSTRLVIEI